MVRVRSFCCKLNNCNVQLTRKLKCTVGLEPTQNAATGGWLRAQCCLWPALLESPSVRFRARDHKLGRLGISESIMRVSMRRLTTVLRGTSVASLRRIISSSQPHSNLTKSFAAPLLIASAGFGLASSGVFADNGWIEVDAFGVDELEDGEMKAVSWDTIL
jgi:hypothetical protein